ncbi:MAG: AAA family ATPase [Candidatus Accumulibacter phosphatis]|nr:AAA family ATPase [Candidatus Accumulibacter phosphatis]
MMRDDFTEIERARSALWHLDAGTDRDTWRKNAMAAKAAGLDFDDFHSWSQSAGNYKNEADCRAVWQSIKPGGITEASLFHAARAAGWTDNEERPAVRPSSHQERPPRPEQPKAPLHNPNALWDACVPATAEHPYIIKKLGLTDGLRVYHGQLTIAGQSCDGALVLPVRTLDGELASLQFIMPDGKKLFLSGCKLPHDGCLIVGGSIRPEGDVHVVEGVGQAWSAHQATRQPAVVAFGVGRMAGVARALHERCPAVRLVLVADAGKESQCAAIAKSISGSWVEMPAGSPSNFDLNDFHQAEGLDAVRRLLEGTKEHSQRFRLMTPADLASLPPVRWSVRGGLPAEGCAAVFGPSGSGKTFLAMDMLAAISSGADWFGCRVARAPVIYIALEGEAGIAQRVKAYQAKHGQLSPDFRFVLQSIDIRDQADRADLVNAVKSAGCTGGVLCLDTLNRAAPGMDENDSKSMGEAISAIKAIQAELGGLILLVHHTGKDSTKGLRGHSSLHAALDAAIEVTRTDDRREWRIAKAKDGEDGEAHPFQLDVVQIGEDEDGDPVTSCVVVPEESIDDALRRTLPPKTGNQRIIWDAIQAVLKASTSYGQAGAPPTRPCVRLEDAVDKTRGRLVCDQKRQTERTQNAISGLVTKGLLEHREGWLWLA